MSDSNSTKTQGNIEVRTKALVGYTSEKIIEYAEQENIDIKIVENLALSGASRGGKAQSYMSHTQHF